MRSIPKSSILLSEGVCTYIISDQTMLRRKAEPERFINAAISSMYFQAAMYAAATPPPASPNCCLAGHFDGKESTVGTAT
jgi:hypothetical protein